MYNRKLLLATGIVVLTITAAFARRSSSKGSITTIYISTSGGGCKWVATFSGSLFTTGGFGTQASMNSSGNNYRRKFWGSNLCGVSANPVHFHG